VGPLCGELGLLRFEIEDLGFGDRVIGHAARAPLAVVVV
jgi:hypothetical protein